MFFCLLLGLLACNDRKHNSATQEIISEVKSKFAPDGRTAIFNIEIDKKDPKLIVGETNLVEAKDALLNRFLKEGISYKSRISLLPDSTVGEKPFGLINVSVANLRSNPKHSAELVTQALLGTPVNLLKNERGWCLVQTPDKYIAWTNAEILVSMDEIELDRWKKKDKIIYLESSGFAVLPSKDERVSDLVAGNVLVVEEAQKGFWLVQYPDGRSARIHKEEAANLHEWSDGLVISDSAICRTAMDFMGIPYLWGGTSTKGMDCSGFTRTVYLLNGILLPRDASQQVHCGDLVDSVADFTKLEVGDLLFFGTKNDVKERVVHVGLWIGNDQFIHASSDVHISSMDSLAENFDKNNFSRYLRTMRIIGSQDALYRYVSNYFLD